ncbi:MAG: PSD1 and planctomycete cytochrome C domain-containing protein [Phycisphaeraceae bacterium]|nr:PSD1 and planctomycete cytochrome C domain-containing protein [Phycisphaeraceae bacterium]
MKTICFATLVLGLSAFTASAKDVDFHTQVAPILMKHCYECHGGTEAKGGFSINTRALWLDKDAAEPGDGDGSFAIDLMRDDDPESMMPPKGKPRPTKAEIETLVKWIDQGMAWDEGFTFAKSTYEPPLEPRRPKLPKALPGRDNPVDRIIDAYLAKQGLKPQPPLDDAAFYRRASMDLIGLLPDPAEVQRFVESSDPKKHEALVDKLLTNDRGYAQHWMTFFNDLLRNDFTGTGYITGGRRSITNWLYKSLLENKPYDQFTRELLAPTPDSEGFIKGIQWRGDVNSSQTTEVQFAQNVGQVFLGINIKCASCHDSFLDSWSLEESYSLAAIYSDKPLEINRCDKPTGEMAKPGWLFPELGEVDAKAPRNERLKQLGALMTHEGNGRLTRTITNRLWHRMLGRGIIHPVDAMETKPWSEDLLDQVAIHLSDEAYDLKAVLRLIATSHAYRARSLPLEEEPEPDSYAFAGPLVKRMTAEQLVDAIRQVTQTQTTNAAKKFPAQKIEQQTGTAIDVFTTRASMLPSDFLQRALGRPNREQVVTSRPQELTTLQALDLSNGEALNKMIQQGATSLLTKHKDKSPHEVIELVYQRALSRDPKPAERNICRRMLGAPIKQQGLEDMLWSIFMLPEFQHIR